MPIFNTNFGFRESPFDQYVAEREPKIDEYAVKPPYFDETRRRVTSVSSHMLFGFRGSGKSATRITTEKETWKDFNSGRPAPLLVSFTDFDPVIGDGRVDNVSLNILASQVAFLALEAILLWMSNNDDGDKLFEALNETERHNLIVLTKVYYLSRNEGDRAVSQAETMKLLHQNWQNRTGDWLNRRWSSISKIVGTITSSISNSKWQTGDISKDVSDLLERPSNSQSARSMLSKLVEVARSFGFTGICVFVDKVDEHAKTQRSTEETAKLILPIVSQVQMMEINGFAWVFFLWDKVKPHLSTDKYFARMDKFAHSEVAWSKEFLEEMVNNRLSYFSDGRITELRAMCSPEVDAEGNLTTLISLVQHSPRELVRILDVISREFNSSYAHEKQDRLLIEADFEAGQDVYVRDVLWTAYDNRILSQLLRFNITPFTNKDVQQAFRISSAGARGRIQSWEACGAVSLTGTRAPEGDSGGKPANEYSIIDPRIRRMAERKLYDPEKLTEAPLGDTEDE